MGYHVDKIFVAIAKNLQAYMLHSWWFAVVYRKSLMCDGYCGLPSMFKCRWWLSTGDSDRWPVHDIVVVVYRSNKCTCWSNKTVRIQDFKEFKLNVTSLFCISFVLLCLIVEWDDCDVAAEEMKKGKKNKSDNVDVISVRKIGHKKRKKKPQKSNFVKASTNAFGNYLC